MITPDISCLADVWPPLLFIDLDLIFNRECCQNSSAPARGRKSRQISVTWPVTLNEQYLRWPAPSVLCRSGTRHVPGPSTSQLRRDLAGTNFPWPPCTSLLTSWLSTGPCRRSRQCNGRQQPAQLWTASYQPGTTSQLRRL